MRARNRTRAVAAGAGAALALAFVVPMASADPYDFHELEGNILDDSPADPPYDWSDIFQAGATAADEPTEVAGLPDSILDPDFTRDFKISGAGAYVNGDDSYYATGSKDTLDITPGWQCKRTNNATDKGDWVNAYAYAARVDHDDAAGTPDHTIFYFGLEKDDDNGTNNVGIWLLQDEQVGCVATGGGNFDWSGNHVDGDLLGVVEYDSGGTVGTASGYVWNGGLPGTATFSEAAARCNPEAPTYQRFCITTNSGGQIASPWWSPQKNDKSEDVLLQTNVFVEGYLDITEIFAGTEGGEPCFATSVANSRASTSTTAALYDFVEIEAATCGPLTAKKYFDRNGNGSRDTGEPYLAGWDFQVFADGQSGAGNELYTGTTGDGQNGSTLGAVSWVDVPVGEYDVYETLKDGYYNSDPGPDDGSGHKDVAQTPAGTTVEFGNACYVAKTFNVTGVPTGTDLELVYDVNNSGVETTVDMAVDSTTATTRSYTLSGTLKPTDVIDWTYQLDGVPGSRLPLVENDEILSDYTDTSGIGTACVKSNTTAFPLTTLNGTKYKDADADGDITDNDAGIDGFEFKLYTGSAGATGTLVDTKVSNASGAYSFTGVAPGTYSVVESSKAGWTQTYPATFHTVTVALGDSSKTIGDFLNAPLTDIFVEVDPQTEYTFADSIQCRDAGNGTVGTDVDGGTDDGGDTKTVDANDLTVGTYVCTIVITDP